MHSRLVVCLGLLMGCSLITDPGSLESEGGERDGGPEDASVAIDAEPGVDGAAEDAGADAGPPMSCAGDGECTLPTRPRCLLPEGRCVECLDDDDCGGGRCVANACVVDCVEGSGLLSCDTIACDDPLAPHYGPSDLPYVSASQVSAFIGETGPLADDRGIGGPLALFRSPTSLVTDGESGTAWVTYLRRPMGPDGMAFAYMEARIITVDWESGGLSATDERLPLAGFPGPIESLAATWDGIRDRMVVGAVEPGSLGPMPSPFRVLAEEVDPRARTVDRSDIETAASGSALNTPIAVSTISGVGRVIWTQPPVGASERGTIHALTVTGVSESQDGGIVIDGYGERIGLDLAAHDQVVLVEDYRQPLGMGEPIPRFVGWAWDGAAPGSSPTGFPLLNDLDRLASGQYVAAGPPSLTPPSDADLDGILGAPGPDGLRVERIGCNADGSECSSDARTEDVTGGEAFTLHDLVVLPGSIGGDGWVLVAVDHPDETELIFLDEPTLTPRFGIALFEDAVSGGFDEVYNIDVEVAEGDGFLEALVLVHGREGSLDGLWLDIVRTCL